MKNKSKNNVRTIAFKHIVRLRQFATIASFREALLEENRDVSITEAPDWEIVLIKAPIHHHPNAKHFALGKAFDDGGVLIEGEHGQYQFALRHLHMKYAAAAVESLGSEY